MQKLNKLGMPQLPRKMAAACLLAVSAISCKPKSEPEVDQAARQQQIDQENRCAKIKFAGFPKLAGCVADLLGRESRGESMSSETAIRFSAELINCWTEDLSNLGIKIPPLPANHQDATAALTWLSLQKGYFIQPAFSEKSAGSNQYSGRLGFYKVKAIPSDKTLLAAIKIGNFSPQPADMTIHCFNVSEEIVPATTGFIATTDRIDNSAGQYFTVLNPAAMEYTTTTFAYRSSEEYGARKDALVRSSLINEFSIAALDQYFESKGITCYRDRGLEFGNGSGVRVSLGGIYEAFSDLASWKYANLSLAEHMQLLNSQMNSNPPKDYGLTLSLQSAAISTVTNHNPELAKLINIHFRPDAQVTFGDLVPLLQSNPGLDRALRAEALAILEKSVDSILFSACRALREDNSRQGLR